MPAYWIIFKEVPNSPISDTFMISEYNVMNISMLALLKYSSLKIKLSLCKSCICGIPYKIHITWLDVSDATSMCQNMTPFVTELP